MMNIKRLISGSVFIGGILELAIALLHFLWPLQLVRMGDFAGLSIDYMNFLVLCCIAVGLCLAIFGILSIFAARELVNGEYWAWIYVISQGILWLTRMLLEIIFPVRIPLFFITNPTVLVLPLTLLLSLLYWIPFLVFRKKITGAKKLI
jgi:hypothetical protein